MRSMAMGLAMPYSSRMDARRSWIAVALAVGLAACGGSDSPRMFTEPPPGAFDSAFGSQGIAVIAAAEGWRGYAAAVAIDGAGRPIVAGSEATLGFEAIRFRPLFVRFTLDGMPDPAWASNGIFRPFHDPAVDREGTYVAAISDDRSVLGERLAIRCGVTGDPACGPLGQLNSFFAQRHLPDGGIDDTYGVMSTVSIAATRPAVVSFGGGALAVFGATNVPTSTGGAQAVFRATRVDDRGQNFIFDFDE